MIFSKGIIENTQIITIDSLNQMFNQKENPKTIKYESECYICGCGLDIDISKTSGGYGLLGGVLYEKDSYLYAICAVCYQKYCESE